MSKAVSIAKEQVFAVIEAAMEKAESAGMVPQKDQAEAFRMIAGEFFPIGDCVKANNVRTAVRTGYDSAIQL